MKLNFKLYLLTLFIFTESKLTDSWIYYDQKENISKYRYNWQELRESMEKVHGIHDIIVSFQKTIKNVSELFKEKQTEILNLLSKNKENYLNLLEHSSFNTKNQQEIIDKINKEIENVNQSIKNLEMIFINPEELEKEKEPYTEIIFELENYISRVNNFFNNIENLKTYSTSIENFLSKLQENILKIDEYEADSWDNFKKIDELVNNKIANELIQKTEYNLQQVQIIKNYIYGNFLQNFNSTIQNTLKSLNNLLNETNEIITLGKELFSKTNTQNDSIKEKLKKKEEEAQRLLTEEELKKKQLEELRLKQELEKANTFFQKIKKYFSHSIKKTIEITNTGIKKIKEYIFFSINFFANMFKKKPEQSNINLIEKTVETPINDATLTPIDKTIENAVVPKNTEILNKPELIAQAEIQLIPSLKSQSLPSSEKNSKAIEEEAPEATTVINNQPETIGVLYNTTPIEQTTETAAISAELQVLDNTPEPEKVEYIPKEEEPSTFQYKEIESLSIPTMEAGFGDQESTSNETFDGTAAIRGQISGPKNKSYNSSENSSGGGQNQKSNMPSVKRSRKNNQTKTSASQYEKAPEHKTHRN